MLVSSYILGQAAKVGAGRSVLARMAFNIAVEGLAGLVPFAGDVFDAAWKANQRNVRLLDAWVARPARAERSSRLFLAGLALALVAVALVPLGVTYILLRWLVG